MLLFVESMNLTGLNKINWDELFSLPKYYWSDDANESKRFLEDQVGEDVPKEIKKQLADQKKRIDEM